MIPEELRKLITKYCASSAPSQAQEDEINDLVFELGADPMEVISFIEEIKESNISSEVDNTQRLLDELARQEERRAEIAAARATSTLAEAEIARNKAEEAKAQLALKKEQEKDKRNKKRLFFVAGGLAFIVLISLFSMWSHLRHSKSATKVIADEVYNKIEGTKIDIDDVEVDMSNVPSDDPSVIIQPNGDIKAQLEKYYETVFELQGGFYKIKDKGKYGLADKSGKIIQRPKYDYIHRKNDLGLIKVEDGDHYGYLNIKGIEIVPPIYSQIFEKQDGLIKVEIDGRYGFLDGESYEVVTPCLYSYIYSLEGGKYKVKVGSKTGYLDEHGKLLEEVE